MLFSWVILPFTVLAFFFFFLSIYRLLTLLLKQGKGLT